MNDLATEAFNLAQDNEARVEATKLKLVAVLMTKVIRLQGDTSGLGLGLVDFCLVVPLTAQILS